MLKPFGPYGVQKTSQAPRLIINGILLLKIYYIGSDLSYQILVVHYSNPGNLTCVVPQGPILRALLFLLRVNDMPQSVSCELLLYADDSCLVFTYKNCELLLYADDSCLVFTYKNCELLLYADDSCLVFTDKNCERH